MRASEGSSTVGVDAKMQGDIISTQQNTSPGLFNASAQKLGHVERHCQKPAQVCSLLTCNILCSKDDRYTCGSGSAIDLSNNLESV